MRCQRAWQLTAAILACMSIAVACAKDSGTRASSPDPPSKSPRFPGSTSPSPTGAEAEVLATYRKLQDAVTEAYAHPKRPPAEVARYAYGDERSEIYATVFQYRQDGVRLKGKPRISPRVTALDESRKVATVTDCVDDSGWIPIDASTGKSVVAGGQNHRYAATAQLKVIDGRWYVVSSKAHRDRTCALE